MDSHNRFIKWLVLGFVLSLFLGLAACNTVDGVAETDGAPSGHFDANSVPNAVPKYERLSHSGNPSSYVVGGKRYYVMKGSKGYDKIGYASWYGTKFHGRLTSSDEPYNMYAMTAASTSLPIPTYVRVTNLENGKSVVVKVNDRGPFHSNRIIDLSFAAAKKLGYADKGSVKVRVTAIDVGGFSSEPYIAQNETADHIVAKKPASLKAKVSPKSLQLAKNDKAVYLQVGTFKTRTKAETVKQQIAKIAKQNGTQVAVKESHGDGVPLYRVHMGPLKNSAKSKQVAELLAAQGFNRTVTINNNS